MMHPSSSQSPSGDELKARLGEIERLLASDPEAADVRATELLTTVPGQQMALLFQGIARRLAGKPTEAVAVLETLCKRCPEAPLPHLQLGLALQQMGEDRSAVEFIRRATEVKPDFSDAWLALGEICSRTGDRAEADRAFAMYIQHCAQNPRLRRAAGALRENRLVEAESILRDELKNRPNDIAVLSMLGDVSARQSRFGNAEALLRRCVSLAPHYRLARQNYAVVLLRQDRPEEALAEVDVLLAERESPSLHSLKAAILVRLLRYDQAIEIYEKLVVAQPDAGIWASLGHALRTVGRIDECIDAYRKAIALAPQFGEAYWNLANLKTVSIADEELEAMREHLRSEQLRTDDRIHFRFALGKALEDRRQFAEAFAHYAEGNRLRREKVEFNAAALSAHVDRAKTQFTSSFFHDRESYGSTFPGPIFIVGLPRSGSTLVEQILASHSLVEGTMELPHIAGIARTLVEEKAVESEAHFIEAVSRLSEEESRELGRIYLERTASQRQRACPYFIDKMPNNFAHTGLIQLMFPEASVIDVRRHPMACGVSLFRHLFASGQTFSYSLEDIAFYYRQYVHLMSHFDDVLPGRVHRVIYESLVSDFEDEVRRMLNYCGLPFEDSCLQFHRNSRAVSTPSSEQVRRPIFRDGLEHWRHYTPWLGPLEEGLGPLVHHWRESS